MSERGATDDRFSVSVVCTGNICRSPMAATVLRHAVAGAGLSDRVRVSSAGTGPWHVGGPAHAYTRRVLADAGFDTEHIASQITRDEMPTVDLLLAADRTHLAALTTPEQPTGRTAPAATTAGSRAAGSPWLDTATEASPSRIVLFRSFDPQADDDEIPDPYGGPHEEYLQVLSMIRAAVPGIVDEIRRRLA